MRKPGSRLVRAEGLEPPQLSSLEPKSSASTSSATPARTASSRVDLTFATAPTANVDANVKFKTPLQTCICWWNSNIRKHASRDGMRVFELDQTVRPRCRGRRAYSMSLRVRSKKMACSGQFVFEPLLDIFAKKWSASTDGTRFFSTQPTRRAGRIGRCNAGSGNRPGG
jgi:hypothetical protein